MYLFRSTILYFLFSLALTSQTQAQKKNKPDNIIFIIGDGMGLTQVSLLYTDNTRTNFERFTTTGLVKTSSTTHKITDSAAGATAYSTGKKTYNYAIGMDRDTIPATNITELLKSRGFTIGIVVTSSITHATPASFYAHVANRNMEEEIASQLISSKIDYIAGGGIKFFTQRKDGINLLDTLNAKGYETILKGEPDKLSKDKPKVILLANNGMPAMSEGRGKYLSDYTQKALDFLKEKRKPFFLLIEGSQIDWAGHNNDSKYLLEEMKDFDQMLERIFDFRKKNPKTLVIVTADHETGGLSLAPISKDYNKLQYQFTTTEHTSTMVPVFAIGPGAENFSGIMENTDIHTKILKVLGVK
jgi:alkaline phosphatase